MKNKNDEILTDAELCELLKVHRATLWAWRKKGLPHIKSGTNRSSVVRYRKSEVFNWLEDQGKIKK